jgi:hypothetical protein
MSRILAYPQSIRFFLLAKKHWPELFANFQVFFVPSSEPISRPRRNKSESAKLIIGRMTRKEKDIRIFTDFVNHLQIFDLDQRIKAEYEKDTFRPIVHSEVLLLNHLETNGGVANTRFFNGWKYIGTSKLTCKLCHYYFEEHRSKVQHRESHGNLYVSWRFPDVLQSQGEEGERRRQTMVDRILPRIRKEAFDLVKKRIPSSYKQDDSNTFSARMTFENWTWGSSSEDVEDAASVLGQVDLNG